MHTCAVRSTYLIQIDIVRPRSLSLESFFFFVLLQGGEKKMKTRDPLIKANTFLCDVSGELHVCGLFNTGFMRCE